MTTLRRGSTGRMVRTLQHWLNVLVRPDPTLPENTNFGPQTENAVMEFKRRNGLTPVNGEVDPTTWAAIGQAVGMTAWVGGTLAPLPIWRTLINDLSVGPLNFRHDFFFKSYMETYSGISESQLSGLSRLLRFIDRDAELNDVRWAAYMLATVKHECADTWQPIEEYGRGAGHSYGNEIEVTAADGTTYNRSYYGRGYVQLTWKSNYETMGTALGMGQDLVIYPERVLQAETAYRVMSHGMRNGSFTGKKLSDYITGNTVDYVNARRIINGTDRADLIAGYATRLETMLQGALYI